MLLLFFYVNSFLRSIQWLLVINHYMLSKQQRANKINAIKLSLKTCKILSKNSLQIQEKQQKIRTRRQSVQICSLPDEKERLLRRYSDQDEEQDKMNINTFNQKYILQEMIGQGANARVHKCEYRQTKKKYAVKIMVMEQEHVIDIKKSFITIKNFRNKSIIKYHALYFHFNKRLAFLIMEYFPYPNLLEITGIKQEDLKLIFIELLNTILFLHDRNVCHRDIKPQNILYDSQFKRIKLIDFGISARTYKRGGHCDLLTIIGTSLYMAPEIYEGGGYDQRIDLWAVGVTLYRMIAGMMPFQSQYHSDLVNKIVKMEVRWDENVWCKFSYFVKDLIKRLLKGRQERLSINEARNHLWFQNVSAKSSQKIRKRSSISDDFAIPKFQSFSIKIQKVFNQNRLLTVRKLSIEREDDSQQQATKEQSPKLKRITVKRLNLIQNKQFDMQDSQQEQISPSTVTKKSSINSMV